jgi:hypothetical protein
LIELELDFSQEDVEFADRKLLHDLVEEVDKVTISLIDFISIGKCDTEMGSVSPLLENLMPGNQPC